MSSTVQEFTSHILTIGRRARDNARENIPALVKNPAMVFTETDGAWFQHSVQELRRGLAFELAMHEQLKEQKEAEQKAKEEARKEWKTLEVTGVTPTRQELLNKLEDAGSRFKMESEACKLLETYVLKFADLEFMRMTQTGQTAYQGVASLLRELSEQASTARVQYDKWKSDLEGIDTSTPATESEYVSYKMFRGRYSRKREAWVVDELDKAANVCAYAIRFETVKAYVVSLEGTDENPDRVLNDVKKHVMTASGSVTTASNYAPGQPGTILGAVGAFVDAGTNVVNKMATSAIRARRVEKIIKSPEGEKKVVQAMNQDATLMAEYLRKKFIANLEFGLSQVKPMIKGAAMGLDAAALEVPAGTLLSLAWDIIVDVIVEVADQAQQAKIAEAKKKFEDLKSKSELPKKTTPIWKKAYNELEELFVPENLDDVLDNAAVVAAMGANWKNLDIPGRKPVIRKLASILRKEVLSKMKMPPADIWSGDDFTRHLTRLETFKEDRRRMGFGVYEDEEAS